MAHVARLRIYPIKSCRGYDVSTASLDARGLIGDRRYMVVSPSGEPFTQRSHPTLARVEVRLATGQLVVSAAGIGEFTLNDAERTDAATMVTSVWSDTGLHAHATTAAADDLFSTLLGTPARLLRVGAAFDRPVQNHPSAQVGFADAFPVLVISEASLANLNDHLIERNEEPVAMERFRPNLVVGSCAAFAEDQWQRIQIADARFQAAGPCERCIMTTLDPLTGERLGPEPLRTLATYRRGGSGSGVIFGQNLVHLFPAGTLTIGDPVSPME